MGQYYNPVINGIVYSMQSVQFRKGHDIRQYNSLKLTAHSMFDNFFINFLAWELYKSPKTVLWCGDYSEENKTLGISDVDEVDIDAQELKPFDFTEKYLVNHTKGIYFDLGKVYNKSDIFFPIPILTCTGNGKGGGDYFGALNSDMVGTWKGNVLEITNKSDGEPFGYQLVDFSSFIFADDV